MSAPTPTPDAQPPSGPDTRLPRSAGNHPALLVPLLVVLGIAGVVAYMQADAAHVRAALATCRYLPPISWQMYVTAYGALACSVLAGALLIWLLRRAARHGKPITESWQGTLAIALAVLGVFPFLLQCFVVWELYQPNPAGVLSCAS